MTRTTVTDTSTSPLETRILDRETLRTAFVRVRANTIALTNPLEIEDQVVQTCEEVSPTKWHLGHTSWFFETLILKPFLPDYEPMDERYEYIFNSYYNAVGPQFSRPHRGLLSRPTVSEIHDYRAYIERWMETFFRTADAKTWARAAYAIEVGLHHEQQHQELILTDIKEVLSHNPLAPAPYAPGRQVLHPSRPQAVQWHAFEGGLSLIGHDPAASGATFAFDNECPRHEELITPFELASRPVTNREFLTFVKEGGYQDPAHWFSDGWALVQQQGWTAPLYWQCIDGEWRHYTLCGLMALDPHAPVSHVSFYEASAYASWAGARLPTEFEWEHAAATQEVPSQANLLDFSSAAQAAAPVDAPRPRAVPSDQGLSQMFGDVWEWTMSPYAPYRGYQTFSGPLSEYNGKFMCNQYVLRGGACTTPRDHIRRTYRNFFPPDARWQLSGFRLARDDA